MALYLQLVDGMNREAVNAEGNVKQYGDQIINISNLWECYPNTQYSQNRFETNSRIHFSTKMIAAIAVENEADQECMKLVDLNIGIEYAGTALSAIILFYTHN